MAQYLPIRAVSRSQQVRIGTQEITRDSTFYVDISDGKIRRDLERYQALGSIIVVGGLRADNSGGSGIVAKEVTFTETTGAGVYTGSVTVPAGASILDIVVNGVALWTATTSATLKVGDAADDDGYFTAVNLKATDLLAGESISLESAGGKAGAYVANSQVSPRYSASARTVSGIVTTVGAAGNAGRTRITVTYALPVSTDVTAATKV
jgi:hypothetical protein